MSSLDGNDLLRKLPASSDCTLKEQTTNYHRFKGTGRLTTVNKWCIECFLKKQVPDFRYFKFPVLNLLALAASLIWSDVVN